ncbi:elongation factor G [Seleniivibrio woodruffii]|uniref:Elongation factor G n=1 Tax=Seleniivibrio woodruffii TaxID=1078050 RepID=A0A4R1K9C1_9BACT|nr:elongation factor G [Seleniivibrio woodruffii]TCK60617.1 translation elongation factor 2 (EF-2/EF-G) [Seleniivibrio woodruffii]TVZ36246.1 translation elongation factor 2 (EF-2/EF-G) [Seleniivibrio woodruffii]
MDIKRIRNVAFISHGGAGKTSLVEAILFNAKATNRIGSVDNGTSVMDFDPVEIERHLSLHAKVSSIEWLETQINIVDTPGYANFLHETRAGLSAVGGAVVIASAITGVKAETQRVWKFAEEFDLAKLIFVNKMDKDRADFFRALGDIEKSFKIDPLPIFLPIGKETDFKGIIDLVKMKAYLYPEEPTAAYTVHDIPAELLPEAEKYRIKLLEAVSETDDALIEKYLEEGDLTEEEITKGLREGTISKRFIPVICGSAVKNIGSKLLLEAIIKYLPSPIEREHRLAIVEETGEEIHVDPLSKEFSAYVFKTFIDPFAGKLTIFRVVSGEISNDSEVYNTQAGKKEKITQLYLLQGKNHVKVDRLTAGQIGMVNKLRYTETFDTLCDPKRKITFPKYELQAPLLAYSIKPKSKDDEDKVSSGVHRLMEEDVGLRVDRDERTGDLLVKGMGQMHIEVVVEKLKNKFGVSVELKSPKVPYMETIRKSAKGQGKYKKQSGGRGQYGDVHIELHPNSGSGFEFVNNIVGGAVPRQYIPAVEKGIIEAAQEGVLAGFPLIDFKAVLYDGSYHTVDSSEMAFMIAGSMAFKKVALDAKPVLLEPIMNLDVFVPDDMTGAVIGDLNARRGRIANVEPETNGQHIRSQVPMSEVLKYAPDLRSMTGGHGMFTMEFSHYEELPSHLVDKVIAENKGA